LQNHIAIFLNQSQHPQEVIDAIERGTILDLKEAHGYAFTKATLMQFLKEEHAHDKIEVYNTENKALSTMSSGQQRRALLRYLLQKKADYIVLDDVLSNLDYNSKIEIEILIKSHAHQTRFIQIVYRKDEVFSWIKNKYIIAKNVLVLYEKIENRNDNVPYNLNTIFEKNIKEDLPYTALITMKNVQVSYGDKQVLKGLDWTVNPGEFWQIIGPNGSGKTTLLSMIYGDNPKAYGQDITLFGIKKGSGENIWDIKKKIGYYSPSVTSFHYRNDTAQHMIIGGMQDTIGLYQKPSALEINKSIAWLKALDLVEIKDKPFRFLSSGQQSLIMVARAMIKNPPLLILDEPTIGLDEENARKFVSLVNAIATQESTAILYVSHREEEGLVPGYRLELGR
jgi:molybdate transport system ATP-binding protein